MYHTSTSYSLSLLLLCIVSFSASFSIPWRDDVESNVTRIRRQTKCRTIDFQCDSGNCIDDNRLCDGKPDCPDNSDETTKQCTGFPCPRLSYQCIYGACTNQNARCNTIVDCVDGSDEDGCSKNETNSASEENCVLPNHPENGKYSVGGTVPETYKSGSYVPNFSVLVTTCNVNYGINPLDTQITVCSNGMWLPELPNCSRTCDGINSTSTTSITCSYNGRPLSSCDNPIHNTVADIKCAPLHEEPSLAYYPLRVCKDGKWDRPPSLCYPVCGIKRPKGTPNIINGAAAKLGDYPWHAGIFLATTKESICGGSVISNAVVLSAAHCFTDLGTGVKNPKESYLVAAGKYYRQYDDKRDTEAQYSEIVDIHIPIRYKGDISQYEGDIAVVILAKKLIYTTAVLPVCIDWTNFYENQQIFGGNLGTLVGWGQTVEGDRPSDVLKELAIPVIPYEQCFNQVPKSFRRFLTHDKVCAGFLNNATAACQGDSGGGLTFPNAQERFYIRGIVSTSPATTEKACDSNQYGTYTLVSKYIEFIRIWGLQ